VTLDDLPANQVDAVEALLGRLKHDLGKYVSLQARWLAPDATVAERREALATDVLQTRRGPDGTTTAHQVWAPFRAVLFGEEDLVPGVPIDLSADPDVARIAQAMTALQPTVVALRSGELSDAAVEPALGHCHDVAAACRDLVRRVRALRPS